MFLWLRDQLNIIVKENMSFNVDIFLLNKSTNLFLLKSFILGKKKALISM